MGVWSRCPPRYRFSCILSTGIDRVRKRLPIKEKLQEFALITELISAAEIVASLISIGMQIQQTNQLSELEVYESRTAVLQAINGNIALPANLSEIVIKRSNLWLGSLREIEVYRLRRCQLASIKALEPSYYRFQLGYLGIESGTSWYLTQRQALI